MTGLFTHQTQVPCQISRQLGKLSFLATSVLLIQMNLAHAEEQGVTRIANTAGVDYRIEDNQTAHRKQSNRVDVTAFSLPQYDIALTQPLSITVSPNEQISWVNTLTNTGAFDATIDLSYQVPATLSNFQVYLDTNGNGVVDAGEPLAGTTVSLKAGEQINLIATALTSASLKDGDSVAVPLQAVVQEDTKVSAKTIDALVAVVPTISYRDADYVNVQTDTLAGQPLYVEMGLSLCNTDPNAIDDAWLTIRSEKTGDIIRLKAIETGENTGRYRVTVPTDMNANAIDDAIIQTLDGDVLGAQFESCDGDSNRSVPVSYTTSQRIYTDIRIKNDVPLLSISKSANVSSAEVGDFVEYSVDIKNTGKADANNVTLKDDLPLGFGYVNNSLRVDGLQYPTDFKESGKYMTLGLGTLAPSQSKKVTYRVRIEPTALAGTATNHAHVTATDTLSSEPIASKEASSHVEVSANKLNTYGVIVGKVYADFNRDGIQQRENNELGVPGVRLYLEDGTFVVTDSQGKYSLYGISAKSHVIKLDRTTLPREVELIEQTNRNMSDPNSRFIDLKYGELHRADFAITTGMGDANDEDAQDLIKRLKIRADKVATNHNALEQAIKSNLEIEPKYVSDKFSRTNLDKIEAEGCKDPIEVDGQITCNAVMYDDRAEPIALKQLETHPVAPVKALEIEKALSTADDKRIEGVTADADFLNLTDGQQVGVNKIRVQIKAPQGATTVLYVNDKPVDENLQGKEVAWEKEKISGFDYYAVPLDKGNNVLTIKATDATGKLISSKSIRIHAPEGLHDIETRTQHQIVEADGISQYQVVVSLKDQNNQLYAAGTSVSIDSDIGTILLDDKDKNQAGIQTQIEGGELLIPVRAPATPGKGNLLVRAGTLEKVIPLQFIPKLRPMIATGIVEGVLSFNNLGAGLEPTHHDDGFEEQLQSLSGDPNKKLTDHGRAAFFLKGKVRGAYLLTMAYDSDKNHQDRLFRDIRPDEFYPVYGDASAKGFDAQSTSKLYVRIDKNRSYAMYGDMKTHVENDEGLSLGQYDRTLTGLKTHYETDKTNATAFAAQTRSSQRVNETRGLGISGPYPLGENFEQVLINSETVEVIVRDRNNPGVILSRQALSPFSDYEIDSLSQALYLRAPIASQDLDGNPIYLRISVESENVGEPYNVWGAAGYHRLGDKIRIGGSYAQSEDPTNHETLSSVSTVIDFNPRTKLVAETARYESDKLGNSSNINDQINAGELNNDPTGKANRVELTYKDNDHDARLYYNQADQGFDPLSSPVIAGRTETGLTTNSRLNDKTKLKTEAIQTEDKTTNARRRGALVGVERKISKHITGELGVRYYQKDALAASRNYQSTVATETQDFNQSMQPTTTDHATGYSGTTIRGKITADLPKVNKSKVFVEYEQDIKDADRNAWSVGGETNLWDRGRLYARHELSSSLLGDYGLDANEQRKSTVVGVDVNYMQDGQMFGEYRMRDSISAREAEAAIGVRNKFKLKDGVYLNTSFERLESLEGEHSNDATAATVGLDYLANDNYKFTTRLEKRWGVQTDTLLSTLGYARRINDDMTLLAKNNYSLQQDNVNDNARTLDRFQLGLAYRDYDSDIIDHLAKLEYRYDNNTLSNSPYKKQTYIASLHTNYHPIRRLTLSGHYAGKYNELDNNGIVSDTTTHLLAGRALYDLNERWDIGAQAGSMWSNNSNRYLLGAEVGYSPLANLWLSLGYNFVGYHDDDIASGDDNQQGAYVRMRFKFDEDLFKKNKPNENSRLTPTDVVVVK